MNGFGDGWRESTNALGVGQCLSHRDCCNPGVKGRSRLPCLLNQDVLGRTHGPAEGDVNRSPIG